MRDYIFDITLSSKPSPDSQLDCCDIQNVQLGQPQPIITPNERAGKLHVKIPLSPANTRSAFNWEDLTRGNTEQFFQFVDREFSGNELIKFLKDSNGQTKVEKLDEYTVNIGPSNCQGFITICVSGQIKFNNDHTYATLMVYAHIKKENNDIILTTKVLFVHYLTVS